VTLRSCYWHRVQCGKCGEYDLATATREIEGEHIACMKCANIARVIATATGKTSRALPFAGNERPLCDIPGLVFSRESVMRGRSAAKRTGR
jgi:hypothetical protein